MKAALKPSSQPRSLLSQVITRQVWGLLVTVIITAIFLGFLFDYSIDPSAEAGEPLPKWYLVPALAVSIVALAFSQWATFGRWMVHTTRALRESEERYRLLVENIDAVVFRGNRDGSIDFVDNKIEATTGYSRQEFDSRRKRFKDIVCSEDWGHVKRVLLDALKQKKKGYSREYQIRCKDGVLVWIHERGHLLSDEAGRLKHVSGLFFDITEQKRVIEALAFERRQLLSIFDSIPDPIFVTDPDTRELLFVNRALKGLVGDATGQKCYAAIHGSDSPCISCPNRGSPVFSEPGEGARDVQYSINGRWYHSTNRKIRWPDGREVCCEMASDIHDLKMAELELRSAQEELELRVARRTAALNAANEKLLQEIAEREKAEKELKESERFLINILDTMHVGVFLIDEESRHIIAANRHAARLVGLERRALIGKKCHKFVCPSEEGKCPASDIGRDIANEERVLLTATGAEVPILKSVSRISRDNRERLIESFIDIRELKALLKEQELDIALAKSILNLTNGSLPHYIELSDRLALSSYAVFLPCHREGGDHYLMREMDTNGRSGRAKTVFSLKDQSGHKVGCVLRSIITDLWHQAVIRRDKAESLDAAIAMLNNKICGQGGFSEKDFITAVNGEIDHETLMLEYVLCGHSDFLVISADEIISVPGKSFQGKNLPIGALGNVSFTAGRIQLRPGDKIILFTDGLLEAGLGGDRAGGGKGLHRFDMAEIVREVVKGGASTVFDILQGAIERVSELSGKRIDSAGINDTEDDISLVGMEIEDKAGYGEESWRPASVEHLQSLIDRFCERHESEWRDKGFEQPLRLRYALSEAVVNAWKHGNECDTSKAIRVRYRYGSDFVLEISDEGQGFESGSIPDPRCGENLLKSAGRGLLLIRRHSTSCRWYGRGNRLVMTFNRVAQQTGSASTDGIRERIGLT